MEPKLPSALAALLGLQGCIMVGPCLEIGGKDTGEQTGDTGRTTTIGPCLSVRTGETGTTQPCLFAPTETGDTGAPVECLSYVPRETGDTAGDTGVGPVGLTERVRAEVIASGRLPDDVVRRLGGSPADRRGAS